MAFGINPFQPRTDDLQGPQNPGPNPNPNRPGQDEQQQAVHRWIPDPDLHVDPNRPASTAQLLANGQQGHGTVPPVGTDKVYAAEVKPKVDSDWYKAFAKAMGIPPGVFDMANKTVDQQMRMVTMIKLSG